MDRRRWSQYERSERPTISICLARLPAGQTDPLSARSRSSQTKRTVRIGVGLLPYISIASIWQQRRPLITDLAACRHRLTIDTSSCRMVALGDVASVISRSSYLFGVSWPDVRRTLLSEAAMGWLFSSTALSGYVDVSASNREDWRA